MAPRGWNDLGTEPRVGGEHAVEANAASVGATGPLPANPGRDALHEMEPWTRHELGQLQPALDVLDATLERPDLVAIRC